MFILDKIDTIRRGRCGSTVETCSGRYVDVRHPDPATISRMDIAHALSMQCRFNGHVRNFYSVAEHCVRVADHLPDSLRIHGLLHDAAEAYVGDVVTPVKRRLYGFAGMEDRVLRAIYAHLQVPCPGETERGLVHQADLLALREEAWALLPSQGRWHINATYRQAIRPAMDDWPLQVVLCLAPAAAKALWLESLNEALGHSAYNVSRL